MAVEIRRVADAVELEAVLRFRYMIYGEELGAFLPAEAHAARRLGDELDARAHQYAVFDGGRVVGGLRVADLVDVAERAPLRARYGLSVTEGDFAPQEICVAGRLALDTSRRGGRCLVALMLLGLRDLIGRGVRLVFADCSPQLLPLYERLGFRRCASPFNDPTYGFKLPIVLIARDHEGLRAQDSPLSQVANAHQDDETARAWYARVYPEHLSRTSAALLPAGAFLDLVAARIGDVPTRRLALLSDLSNEQANAVLAHSTLVIADRGDQVIRAGLRDDTIFLVISGTLEVVDDSAPHEAQATIGPGGVFGELSFLVNVSGATTVIARERAETVVVSGEFLRQLVERDAALAARVWRNLAIVVAMRLIARRKSPG